MDKTFFSFVFLFTFATWNAVAVTACLIQAFNRFLRIDVLRFNLIHTLIRCDWWLLFFYIHEQCLNFFPLFFLMHKNSMLHTVSQPVNSFAYSSKTYVLSSSCDHTTPYTNLCILFVGFRFFFCLNEIVSLRFAANTQLIEQTTAFMKVQMKKTQPNRESTFTNVRKVRVKTRIFTRHCHKNRECNSKTKWKSTTTKCKKKKHEIIAHTTQPKTEWKRPRCTHRSTQELHL